MRKLYNISWLIYTSYLLVLIFLFLFLKAHSYTSDYYPLSFILSIVFLLSTVLALLGIKFVPSKKRLLKIGIRWITFLLVLASVIFQVYFLLDGLRLMNIDLLDILLITIWSFFIMLGTLLTIGILKYPTIFNFFPDESLPNSKGSLTSGRQ